MTAMEPRGGQSDQAGRRMAPILEARNISKSYSGTQALDSISVDLFAREVHAVVGENGAGKTTLLNILSGVVTADSDQILLHGEPVRVSSPRHAQELGIGTVFQELSLVPGVSVAENVFPNRAPTVRGGLINWRALYARTRSLMAEFGVDIDVRQPVGELPIGTRQLVEIAKALSVNADILLLDEPTSALTPDEISALFAVIRRLRANGMGIIYVSHQMREIFEIADRVTVLRDGRRMGTYATAETSPDKVIRLMVGRALNDMFEPRRGRIGAKLLQADRLSRTDAFHHVDITLRQGEIVGLAGLMGSGRSELAHVLAGVKRPTSGTIRVDGHPVYLKGVADAVALGISFLPEERKRDGLFLEKSIGDNIIVTAQKRFSRFGLVDTAKRAAVARDYVARLDIRTPSINQLVGRLSGGNQQKVLLAKWLVTEPRILVVDEPTKGIDVGAKFEIHALLRHLADNGTGVIVISSDLPELLGLCDRILVMREGRITGEAAGDSATEEAVMALASGLSRPPSSREV